MAVSLKTKTIGALKWSFVQEFAQRGLQFGIGIILARLLQPEEFGLVAMLSVFIAVAQALLESGFGAALIQRKHLTAADQSSVFYFNICISVLLAALLCAAAPAIGTFYSQPELIPITRAMTLVLVINGFAAVQNALMTRQLDFRKQTVIAVISSAGSGGVGLTLAWRGYGVWSLVVQQIAASVVRASLYWALNAWRPKWLFSVQSLRELFAFGSRVVASRLLNTFFDNLYPLIIGKLFPVATLGFYNRAHTFQGTIAQSLGAIANRVTFPVFSRLQDDPARMRSGLRKALNASAFIQFPAMIGLAVIAKPLVLLLLTEKWLPSVPYIQALCFVGLLYPLHILNLNVLSALGRSDLFLRLEIIKKILVVVTILVTFRWGVLVMLWGQVVSGILAYALNSYYTKKFIGYSIGEQMRDLYPYLLAAGVMAIPVYWINVPIPAAHPVQLMFKGMLGASLYFLICRVLRLSALDEILRMARRRNLPAVAAPSLSCSPSKN